MLGPVITERRFFPLCLKGIICHKQIIPHHLLHYRMAAVLDVDHALFIDRGLDVVAAGRHRGQGTEHVDSRNGSGRLLDPYYLGRNGIPYLTGTDRIPGLSAFPPPP